MIQHVSILAGAAVLIVWLYLFLRNGNRADSAAPVSSHAPFITAVIPARDEAAVVAQSLGSLAKQNYAGGFRIVLVDDHSSDGTSAIAQSAAPADRLTVIQAEPLPPGWSGKLWAVAQGVARACAQLNPPDYILLTDADIVHSPENLADLTARAAQGYDLVSYMATLQCRSAAERALIPAFVYFFFQLYPPAWIRAPRRSTAGAAGGCILIRREALERIGGIAAIRNELIDDCALARAVKQSGGRVWLGLSHRTRSIRDYATFSEIGRMISRTAFTQLRYSPLLLIGTVLGLGFTYFLPVALALFAHDPTARAMGAIAWLLMSLSYWPILRFYRRSPLWAPLLPLVAAFYTGCTIHSAIQYWRGAGGQWKGRAQARSGKEASRR